MANQSTLSDFIKANQNYLASYDKNTKKATVTDPTGKSISFTSGQANDAYGITGQIQNGSNVIDPNKLMAAFNPTPQQPVQQKPQVDPTNYINDLRDAKVAYDMANLDKARQSALSGLDAERDKIAPAAYADRNKANVTMNNANQAWNEFLAAKGLNSSGIGGTGFLANQNQYQGQIGAINRDATNRNADIDRRTTDVNNAYASDLAAAQAQAQIQALQNQFDQYNRDREFNLNKASTEANIANTQANTIYQNYINQGYPAEQAAKMEQYQADLKAAQLANEAAELAKRYQPQIYQGQIDEQKLKNIYQQKVNEGFDKQFAMEIAVQQANINQSNASAAASRSNSALNQKQFEYSQKQDEQQEADKKYNTYLQMGIERLNQGTSYQGNRTPMYNNNQMVEWVRGLDLSPEQKAKLASDLGLQK